MEKRIYPKEVVLAYIQMYITDDYEEVSNEKGDWINIRSLYDPGKNGSKKLGFNITGGYVYDFHGVWYPSFIDFIKSHQNINEKEALETIVRLRRKLLRRGISISPPQSRPTYEEAKELEAIPENKLPRFKYFEENTIRKEKIGRKGLVYLLKRGIKKKHIDKYNLMYVDEKECWVCGGNKFIGGEKCPNCKATGYNFYFGRVIIPTYENEKLVYFQGRDFMGKNKKFKYMNPSVPKSQVVYFYDKIKEGDRVFVTEGPIDAMMLYDYTTTAMMGNKISYAQAQKLLWKKPSEIIFVPDNDPNAETKKIIMKNVVDNMKTILKLADYSLKVGVYNWYKFSKEKDLNSAGIDYVDENYIFYYNNIKDRVRMKINGE